MESAAALQRAVPDAVLVGGSAAAYYAGHRLSTDHDHIVSDLRDRFDLILDALDREGDFVLNRATPGKIILGELGGIEAGVRQLIRSRPLETQRVTLASRSQITIPTEDEIVRIKGYLIVKRNQVRDYLDVSALSAKLGRERVGRALASLDDYYGSDGLSEDSPVTAQLARQLADPQPRDRDRVGDIAHYKSLSARWADWDAVADECRRIAAHVVSD